MGGEAGVGKTRLATEFVARAGAAGATALVGGCVDVEYGGLPLGPFVEALRDHARGLDATSRADLLAPGGLELARLFPDLVEPPTGPAPAISASAQGRLFELALGLLGRTAADRPLLLVLEDLHWSDRSTRDLLAFLVRNLRAERIVIVATYRSDELYRGHPLRSFLAELDRGRRVHRLDLRPFDRAELAEHLEGLLGSRPERGVVESVFERSQGNAFFAEELVTSEGGEALPPMLHDILLVRIESRSAAAREVLRVVAAGGARVPERLLAAVSQLGDGEREEALREAVEHRRLVPSGRGRVRVPARAAARGRLPGAAARRAQPAARGLRRGAGGAPGTRGRAGRGRCRPGPSLARGARPAAGARRVGRGGPGGRAAVGLRRGPRALRARARAVGPRGGRRDARGPRSRGADTPRRRGGEPRRRSRARGRPDPRGARGGRRSGRRGAAVGAARAASRGRRATARRRSRPTRRPCASCRPRPLGGAGARARRSRPRADAALAPPGIPGVLRGGDRDRAGGRCPRGGGPRAQHAGLRPRVPRRAGGRGRASRERAGDRRRGG